MTGSLYSRDVGKRIAFRAAVVFGVVLYGAAFLRCGPAGFDAAEWAARERPLARYRMSLGLAWSDALDGVPASDVVARLGEPDHRVRDDRLVYVTRAAYADRSDCLVVDLEAVRVTEVSTRRATSAFHELK